MGPDFGFTLDQLMELAGNFDRVIFSLILFSGLSVAVAITKVYPSTSHLRPIIVCGPGSI